MVIYQPKFHDRHIGGRPRGKTHSLRASGRPHVRFSNLGMQWTKFRHRLTFSLRRHKRDHDE